jgi:hypothetical protein
MHRGVLTGGLARAAAASPILGMLWMLGACRSAGSPARPAAPRPAPAAAALGPEVDASTMDRKLLFGYQGWFGCPDDGSPLRRWEHWFRRDVPASPATVHVDFWPDVSELDPDEHCVTPLRLGDGRPASVYSAYNPKTVNRHFRWMKEYGLAGVFLQRFTPGLRSTEMREFRDGVLHNVRAGAEEHGRVFAMMYDISGQREGLVETLERDWVHLVDELRVTESPRYLHHRGKPVLAIWGFGFRDRYATPAEAAELIEFFKNNPDPRYRVTLVGGVPSRWRARGYDTNPSLEWDRVYRAFDVISPWTVGRFRDDATADQFYQEVIAPDLDAVRGSGIEYLPVVFPGFSWHNLKGSSPLNQIPRRGGRFFWRQVQNALRAHCTMLYSAMFDEVDEGTAMYKLGASPPEVPSEPGFVTLDADREPVPSDWYLRLAGEAQKMLRGEPMPAAELPLALPASTGGRP